MILTEVIRMPTDDERREVAESLRGLNDNISHVRRVYEDEGISILCDDQADYYQICHMVTGYLPAEHMHPCDYKEMHDRLADPIEPGDAAKCVAEVKVDGERLEKLVHDAVAEYAGVDREALLALAVNLDARAAELLKVNDLDQSRQRRSARQAHAMDLMAACSRVREALGVVG